MPGLVKIDDAIATIKAIAEKLRIVSKDLYESEPNIQRLADDLNKELKLDVNYAKPVPLS